VGFMFLLALVAEVSWELFENTDFIINHFFYRISRACLANTCITCRDGGVCRLLDP